MLFQLYDQKCYLMTITYLPVLQPDRAQLPTGVESQSILFLTSQSLLVDNPHFSQKIRSSEQ